MVKANELRVGNYFEYCGFYYQSTGVLMQGVFFTPKEDLGDRLAYYSDINPIPLTEEILLKCGFEKCNMYDNTYSISIKTLNGHHDIFIDISANVVIFGMCEIDNFKHLHQLQNLYLALTGEELNVKL